MLGGGAAPVVMNYAYIVFREIEGVNQSSNLAGALVRENVKCKWHQSMFQIAAGTAVRGPLFSARPATISLNRATPASRSNSPATVRAARH